MIKCCVFDFDGTIANTIHTISYYCNYTLEHFNLPTVEEKYFYEFVGNGSRVLIEKLLKHLNVNYTEEYFQQIHDFYNNKYDSDVLYKTELYKGIPEAFKTLKQRGIKIAVFSNKPDFVLQKICVDMFDSSTFDYIAGQMEGRPKKPSPVVLEFMLTEMQIEKSECLYFGDTKTDMMTGHNAGLTTVGVTWGFRARQELIDYKADILIDNPSEIPNLI